MSAQAVRIPDILSSDLQQVVKVQNIVIDNFV